MRSNPVTRGDLRARSRSPRARAAQAAFLGLLAFLAFIALPPVLGRLDAAPLDALAVFLTLAAFGVAYLTSAGASGEIEIDGEKSPEDLLASPFRGWTVARGKLASAAATAAYLSALAFPLAALVGAVRGLAPGFLAAPFAVVVALGIACGALGTLAAVGFDSAAARVLVHWGSLVALFGGLAAWPASGALGPLAAVRDALQGGRAWAAAAALYLAIAFASAALTAWRFDAMKAAARA